MFVEEKIDYLQYSTDKIPPIHFDNEVSSSYMRNYNTMLESKIGIETHMGNVRGGAYLVIIKGKAMDNLRALTSEKGWIDNALSDGARFSRVDWCITQYLDGDGLIVSNDIAQWCIDGLVDSPHLKHGVKSISDPTQKPIDDDTGHIETLYIGSFKRRAKHGIFRSYDKGFEMDLDKYVISRFELEEKRKNAHKSIQRFVSQDVSVRQAFRSRFDILSERWGDMMDCEPMELSREFKEDKSKEDERLSRWKWLVETCAPSLGRQLALDEANGVPYDGLDVFLDAVEKAYSVETRNIT